MELVPMKIRILAVVFGALCLLGCPDQKHSADDGHDHGADKKSEEHKPGDGHNH